MDNHCLPYWFRFLDRKDEILSIFLKFDGKSQEQLNQSEVCLRSFAYVVYTEAYIITSMKILLD